MTRRENINSWGVRDGVVHSWLVHWPPSIQICTGLRWEPTVHVTRKKGHQKASESYLWASPWENLPPSQPGSRSGGGELGAAEEGSWSARYAGAHSKGVWQFLLRGGCLQCSKRRRIFSPDRKNSWGSGSNVLLWPENFLPRKAKDPTGTPRNAKFQSFLPRHGGWKG